MYLSNLTVRLIPKFQIENLYFYLEFLGTHHTHPSLPPSLYQKGKKPWERG